LCFLTPEVRDGPAVNQLAQQQVPQPGHRWGGAAGPASEWLQDQQPDHPGADQPRGVEGAVRRLWIHPVFRGRQRARKHASGDGCHPGALRPGNPRDPGKGAPERRGLSAALACHHPAQPQGLDCAARGRRPLPRRFLAGTPDPDYRRCHQPRPLEVAGKLAARLPAGGAVRRQGASSAGVEGPRPCGHAAHECKPDRQWRSVAQAARHARLPRLRRQSRETRRNLWPATYPPSATSCAKSRG